MYKITLIFLLATLVFPEVVRADNNMICLKQVEIKIKILYPPIRLTTDPERKNIIMLRMPIDCKTGQILKPSSFSEAVNWVDLALPLDFKTGMTGGSYINTYMYTLYGVTVEDQLYEYFTHAWQLNLSNPVCLGAPSNLVIKSRGNTCFLQIIEFLRKQYKNPRAYIAESNN